MLISDKLQELGIVIPKAVAPIANYVGARQSCKMLYISGQLPVENGEIKYIGKVGESVTIDEAKEAAKLCVINIISQLSAILNEDLEKVVSCVKLGVFVNAVSDFTDHPTVANGASDLIVEIFGDAGRHARAAVGVASLPRGVCVEIDAMFEIA
jgi:enamine deaminase RidA (YjgF/YER057c/UK114 family)